MKELINFLLSTNLLTNRQIDFIVSKCEAKKLKPNSFLSTPNKIPNNVAFIVKGVFGVFYEDENGNYITKFLIDENNFIVDIESFINLKPSNDYIQSITSSEILVFSRNSLRQIELEVENWDKVVGKIITENHLKKISLISPMIHENATTRYKNFISKFPDIASKIPLSYVASYLGITQQSLSRIRRNIN
jgi:CRP-like cAMP-binding protein